MYLNSADRSKHHPRDRFLIVKDTPGDFIEARKLVGSQFREATYKLKRNEIFRVPYYEGNTISDKVVCSDNEADLLENEDIVETSNAEVNPILRDPLPGVHHNLSIMENNGAVVVDHGGDNLDPIQPHGIDQPDQADAEHFAQFSS